jgi:hypothetical protein
VVHCLYFPSPLTTRRAAVKVFYPASTRVWTKCVISLTQSSWKDVIRSEAPNSLAVVAFAIVVSPKLTLVPVQVAHTEFVEDSSNPVLVTET